MPQELKCDLKAVKKAQAPIDPRMHSTTRFILRGVENRQQAAIQQARQLMKEMGITLIKRVV